jgi:hypothetical protein
MTPAFAGAGPFPKTGFNILLQMLDDGRLTDGQSYTVDFRKTLRTGDCVDRSV